MTGFSDTGNILVSRVMFTSTIISSGGTLSVTLGYVTLSLASSSVIVGGWTLLFSSTKDQSPALIVASFY